MGRQFGGFVEAKPQAARLKVKPAVQGPAARGPHNGTPRKAGHLPTVAGAPAPFCQPSCCDLSRQTFGLQQPPNPLA